jgi:aspartate-semialdehyde dehydrogenase
MPLLVHGEVTDAHVDIFDREARFIDERLAPLVERYPALKVVFEHVTTREAVAFVRQSPPRVAATITAHHLLLNRNDMLVGGVRPHRFCLPILKREEDRQALLGAATSGDPRFFLGSDSAPHSRDRKECASGCAGVYTGHAALELYAEAFDSVGAAGPARGLRQPLRPGLLRPAAPHRAVRGADALEAVDAAGGDLAFVALDDEHSARFVPRLRQLGYKVVDKSNTYRQDPAVALVVAGVNDGLVDAQSDLVANPNCTTIPLALVLAPLRRRFGLRAVTVASYQAISGAGLATLDQFLLDARIGYQQGDRLGQQLPPGGYVGNTVPHNAKTDDTGFSAEERKLMVESCKILAAPALRISAQCCRVPVAVGHYEQVWLECEQPVDLAEAQALLADEHEAPLRARVPRGRGRRFDGPELPAGARPRAGRTPASRPPRPRRPRPVPDRRGRQSPARRRHQRGADRRPLVPRVGPDAAGARDDALKDMG